MNVLYIAHEDTKFGAPKSLMELMDTMSKGKEVHPIAALHGKDDIYKFCKARNIEAYDLGHINFVCGPRSDYKSFIKYLPKLLLNWVYDLRAFKKLKKYNILNNVDIVHSNVTIISLGARIKQKTGCYHIMHLREPGDTHRRYLYARKNYIQYLNQNVDCFIAISENIKEAWAKEGIDRNRIVVVYNGLNLDNLKASNRKSHDKIRIIIAGSLAPEKGQMSVVEAFHLLDDVSRNRMELDIYGKGNEDYVRQLKEKIEEYHLEDVVFLKGYKNDISKMFDQYDIGIITSKNEPFGRVTVEYMAAGLCVIASRAGANPELIQDGKNGLLYESGNAGDLARKIEMVAKGLVDKDAISAEGSKTAFSRFTTQINAKNICAVYRDCKSV